MKIQFNTASDTVNLQHCVLCLRLRSELFAQYIMLNSGTNYYQL